MDWSDADQWEVINMDTNTTEHDDSNNIISEANISTEPNVINEDHDNVEQHDTDSYFDTSEEFDNIYFSFQSCDDDEYFEAKTEELNKWKKFNVYTEVDDNGQKHITGRWVFSQKLENSTFRPKPVCCSRISRKI